MSMKVTDTNKGIISSKTGINTPKKTKIKQLNKTYEIRDAPEIIPNLNTFTFFDKKMKNAIKRAKNNVEILDLDGCMKSSFMMLLMAIAKINGLDK